MISPDAEQIIRTAAIAERAYWQLVKAAADDPQRKLALFDCRIRIDAELRGEPRPHLPPLVDLNLTIDQDVDRRLEILRPRIEIDVAQERANKRLANGCGPVPLALGYIAGVRRRLKQLLNESGLTNGELAEAIGVAARTVERWLAGSKIPRERQRWLRSVKSLHRGRDGNVHVVMRVREVVARPKRRRAG